MKLFDIIKTIGSGVVREVVPGGGLIIDSVNALLPDDKKLPRGASGYEIEEKLSQLPPEIRAEIINREFDVEEELIKQRGSVVVAEAKGESWLQRNWRPLTMLGLVGSIIAYFMGFTSPDLPEDVVIQIIAVVKIGLGGYVVGRSAEKIAKEPNIAKMFGGKK